MRLDGTESLADFLDRALVQSDPTLPPESCCRKLRISGVESVGADPNGEYTLSARVSAGHPLYKQEWDAIILKILFVNEFLNYFSYYNNSMF